MSKFFTNNFRTQTGRYTWVFYGDTFGKSKPLSIIHLEITFFGNKLYHQDKLNKRFSYTVFFLNIPQLGCIA